MAYHLRSERSASYRSLGVLRPLLPLIPLAAVLLLAIFGEVPEYEPHPEGAAIEDWHGNVRASGTYR